MQVPEVEGSDKMVGQLMEVEVASLQVGGGGLRGVWLCGVVVCWCLCCCGAFDWRLWPCLDVAHPRDVVTAASYGHGACKY